MSAAELAQLAGTVSATAGLVYVATLVLRGSIGWAARAEPDPTRPRRRVRAAPRPSPSDMVYMIRDDLGGRPARVRRDALELVWAPKGWREATPAEVHGPPRCELCLERHAGTRPADCLEHAVARHVDGSA